MAWSTLWPRAPARSPPSSCRPFRLTPHDPFGPRRRRLRYAPGVEPVCFLNARLKELGSEYPSSRAIAASGSSVAVNR